MSDLVKFKLKNNLSCLLIPKNNLKLFTLQIFVRVGARDENNKTRGSSHLLEHMLFKGTKKRPSFNIINKELDSLGGVFNATTSKNMTCYFIKSLSKNIEDVIELFSDIIFNSSNPSFK